MFFWIFVFPCCFQCGNDGGEGVGVFGLRHALGGETHSGKGQAVGILGNGVGAVVLGFVGVEFLPVDEGKFVRRQGKTVR